MRGGANGWGDITSLSGPPLPRRVAGRRQRRRGRLLQLHADGDHSRWVLACAARTTTPISISRTPTATFLAESENGGTAKEWIGATLGAGTYYVRVEAKEAGQNDHKVRYGVKDADPDAVPLVYTPPPQVVQQVNLGAAGIADERAAGSSQPGAGVRGKRATPSAWPRTRTAAPPLSLWAPCRRPTRRTPP